MEQVNRVPGNLKRDNSTFLVICVFTCVPVYWAALFYIEAVTGQEIEELAVAATVCFLGSFYIGWVLAKSLAFRFGKPHKYTLTALGLLIFANIIWLFVHADFPLRSMRAINLLLYWLPFIFMAITIGATVNLVRITFYSQLQHANVNAAQSKSELLLLQSQLSPHFLFNTLNNLYGLSITQHQKMPPLLLKLSELLRYSIYDAKELLVPLKSEITYINNYIDFERIRIGDRLHLTTSIEVVLSHEMKIAPMLLIVFIENAFKHSKNTTDKNVYIDIALKTWNQTILFSVKNSYSNINNERNKLRNDGGLGLANAMKRLQLLYAGDYELTIDDTNGIYSVLLKLKAK